MGSRFKTISNFIKRFFIKKKLVKFNTPIEQIELKCPITQDLLSKDNTYKCNCGTSYSLEVITTKYIKKCIYCDISFKLDDKPLKLNGASSKVVVNSMSYRELSEFYDNLLRELQTDLEIERKSMKEIRQLKDTLDKELSRLEVTVKDLVASKSSINISKSDIYYFKDEDEVEVENFIYKAMDLGYIVPSGFGYITLDTDLLGGTIPNVISFLQDPINSEITHKLCEQVYNIKLGVAELQLLNSVSIKNPYG